MPTVRTRFAPSPTGYLHVGGLRTALYNYLWARKMGGCFILRIEDTDQQRKVEGAVRNLIDTLRWAGLQPDEGPQSGGDAGPYIQSERLPIYQKYAEQLLERGYAYRCFCSAERLQQLREHQTARQLQLGYDRHCRDLDESEIRRKLEARQPYVIRLKVPLEGEIIVPDIVRGRVRFPCELLDDQVLIKTDGYPTYHLANVADDHLMRISHVIRGEEWLSSTPKHVLLYNYLGWAPPRFAHLPLLLNQDRSKLSKRQGDVSVEDYRKKGYLPEALINFLALLGWNPGTDREIFSIEEMAEAFSLERVGKSGAVMNVEKLDWMNGVYIRELEFEDYFRRLYEFIPAQTGYSSADLRRIAELFKPKLTRLREVASSARTFWTKRPDLTPEVLQEWLLSDSVFAFLEALKDQVAATATFSAESFVAAIKKSAAETGLKGKRLWMALRSALTGELHGPDLAAIADILGRESCLQRLTYACAYVDSRIH